MTLSSAPHLSHSSAPRSDDSRSRDSTPRAVVWAVGAAIAALLGGAVYLVAVRGDALLFDLSSLSRFVFCF